MSDYVGVTAANVTYLEQYCLYRYAAVGTMVEIREEDKPFVSADLAALASGTAVDMVTNARWPV